MDNCKQIDISLNRYSVCISINNTRYKKLVENFQKVGLDKPILIDGIKSNDHVFACRKSHLKALQFAIDNEFPYVCIFEDDAYPCFDVFDQFGFLIKEIQENDISFGCIVLGRNGEASGWDEELNESFHLGKTLKSSLFHTKEGYKTKLHKISDNFFTIPCNLFGAHSYIVIKDYYQYALNRFNKCSQIADISLCYDKLKTIICQKCLFIQNNDDGSFYYPKYYNENYTGDIGQFRVLPKGFKNLDFCKNIEMRKK